MPLVIDADALMLLAEKDGLVTLAKAGRPAVLTPHEGELGRLLGIPADEVAARLDVKRETVYAYVSRGRLPSRRRRIIFPA